MIPNLRLSTILPFAFIIIIGLIQAFDEYDQDHEFNGAQGHSGPLPKDKILLRDIKTLTFYRNKRTTSRRTHSIHQLTCVGGTAGCRLFIPTVVECKNTGSNNGKPNWLCSSDISDRVMFKHVEVICEGYDYPEDDYILLGSCGLEFTLDYTDPNDAHHKSYYHHMDEHEKDLHQRRTKANDKTKTKSMVSLHPLSYAKQLLDNAIENIFLIGVFLVLVTFCVLLVRHLSKDKSYKTNSGKKPSKLTYGPLTSAVLTTKKAC